MGLVGNTWYWTEGEAGVFETPDFLSSYVKGTISFQPLTGFGQEGHANATVTFDYPFVPGRSFRIAGTSEIDRLGGFSNGRFSEISVKIKELGDFEVRVGLKDDGPFVTITYNGVTTPYPITDINDIRNIQAAVDAASPGPHGITVDLILDEISALQEFKDSIIKAEWLVFYFEQVYLPIARSNEDWPIGNYFECFPAGTRIQRLDGSAVAIESICTGDTVLSYTADGTLVPGRVTRTFQKDVTHLLDIHGLKVTPGHVTLCGDGMFKGRHVPIIDILLSDGALVTAEGALVRIATHALVGSLADAFVKVAAALTPEDVATDRLTEGEMRVGTLLFDRDGGAVSVLDCLNAEGYAFDPNTGLVAKPGEVPHPLHWFGAIPRPEDYVLRRSRETLAGIVTGGEWEGSPSVLIAARLQHTLGRVH
jgi:hypothetical protein